MFFLIDSLVYLIKMPQLDFYFFFFNSVCFSFFFFLFYYSLLYFFFPLFFLQFFYINLTNYFLLKSKIWHKLDSNSVFLVFFNISNLSWFSYFSKCYLTFKKYFLF